LLDGIEDGSVVLPNFQRDFDWTEGDVASLVATVMVGWPAGSLLLMRGAPTFFTTRKFEGATEQSAEPAYVVLDGQQRLTALFNALRGKGPFKYAIDLGAVSQDEDLAERLEEAIRIFTEKEWSAQPPFGTQRDARLVPLVALTSAPDFFEWRDKTVAQLPPGPREEALAVLSDAYKSFLGTVNHYEFASTILEPDLPAEAVARIFERINKGGLRLSTFDLLVARVYTSTWNLRDEWNRARRETDHIEIYLGDEGLPIIQTIALRSDGDVRRPALLKLSADVLTREWASAVEAMERALVFLVQTGMRNPSWVPYKTLLLPLASLARDFDLTEHRPLVESWLWSRSFGMDYDVASSTKAASDYRDLKEAMDGTVPAPTFRIDPTLLWRATRRQQAALWRSFLSLLLRRGAEDPYSGTALVLSPADASQSVVSSLFARVTDADPEAPHLWVLSQIVLQGGDQHRSRGRAVLAVVLEELAGGAGVHGRLATQFIDPDVLEEAAGNPARLMAARLRQVEQYLQSEFPAVIVGRVEPETFDDGNGL
jgi:hypothetical protein